MIGQILIEHGKFDCDVRIIRESAALGDDASVKYLWKLFRGGNISKDHLEESLRQNQAAKEEMKSEERDRYEKWNKAQAEKKLKEQEMA